MQAKLWIEKWKKYPKIGTTSFVEFLMKHSDWVSALILGRRWNVDPPIQPEIKQWTSLVNLPRRRRRLSYRTEKWRNLDPLVQTDTKKTIQSGNLTGVLVPKKAKPVLSDGKMAATVFQIDLLESVKIVPMLIYWFDAELRKKCSKSAKKKVLFSHHLYRRRYYQIGRTAAQFTVFFISGFARLLFGF